METFVSFKKQRTSIFQIGGHGGPKGQEHKENENIDERECFALGLKNFGPDLFATPDSFFGKSMIK